MTENLKNKTPKSESKKEFIKEYWQERSHNFAVLREQELHSDKYYLWEEEILAKLPEKRPLKILDIGCGAGFFSIILAKHNLEVTGIDICQGMINQARGLAAKEKVKADFYIMDAEQLDFPDETFDVVIARNVTWNLPDPGKGYREWVRVLKHNGILLNYDGEHAKYEYAKLPEKHAHSMVSQELTEKCHQIYQMLEISVCDRPDWDIEYLTSLDVRCSVDLTLSERIYAEKDWFYQPEPIFCIKGIKI